jgi:hypothetical protein
MAAFSFFLHIFLDVLLLYAQQFFTGQIRKYLPAQVEGAV